MCPYYLQIVNCYIHTDARKQLKIIFKIMVPTKISGAIECDWVLDDDMTGDYL